MEAHEIYDIDYIKGRAVFVEVVPLCHFCHNYIHDGRLTDLLQKGKVPHSKFVSIIQHGDRVLKSAGLSRLSKLERDREIALLEADGKLAAWESWRLILDGVEYPPIYKTFNDWLAEFTGEED